MDLKLKKSFKGFDFHIACALGAPSLIASAHGFC